MSSVYGFKYLIFRLHNVYGPRQNISDPYRNVIGIWINCLPQNKKFYIYGNGEQKSAFSYIDDFISMIVKAVFEKKIKNEIFNIGSDEVVALNQLAKIILEEFFGSKVPSKSILRYLPYRIDHKKYRPQEVKDTFCNHKKAKKLLGCKAKIKLCDGIRKTIDWAKSVGPQKFVYLNSFELNYIDILKTWSNRLY